MTRPMKAPQILSACALVALALGLAACSPAATPAPKAATETQTPAAPVPGLASLTGRWGLTTEACAPTNVSRDGVIEIGAGSVQMGLDQCTVTSEKAEPSEVTRVTVTVTCVGGEGGRYERPFTFVSSSPSTMTWVTEGGEGEPYSRCP